MSERIEDKSIDQCWQNFVESGEFDKVPHPSTGYKLGSIVVGRDNCGYKIVEIREGLLIVSIGINPDALRMAAPSDFFRPASTVGTYIIIKEGLLKGKEVIEIPTPPQKF